MQHEGFPGEISFNKVAVLAAMAASGVSLAKPFPPAILAIRNVHPSKSLRHSDFLGFLKTSNLVLWTF